MPVALITGASTGLGYELADALADDGWELVIDARRPSCSTTRPPGWPAAAPSPPSAATSPTPPIGPPCRRRSQPVVELDLLVHNASTLGPTPLPQLTDLTRRRSARVLEVNLIAPAALTAALLPALQTPAAPSLGISSDAAVEHYPGWGAYGASKAALDHLLGTLGVEHPDLHVYAVDPGDMRTEMHQAAFPGRGHQRPARSGDRWCRPCSGCWRSCRRPAGTGRRTGSRSGGPGQVLA